ncbi:hypothetical protein AB0O68_09230 [Streptomyces sp. NPDC087512]|uniref:hypothetical protein n=1 Tax=Streptomyces sp. NPDC087512 TaxID=3155059 RepID=UPI003422153F
MSDLAAEANTPIPYWTGASSTGAKANGIEDSGRRTTRKYRLISVSVSGDSDIRPSSAAANLSSPASSST